MASLLENPIRVGLRRLTPVVAAGVRGWLRRDPRLLLVGPGERADVLVWNPDGPIADPAGKVVAFAPAGVPCPAGAHACVGQDEGRPALIEAILAVAGPGGGPAAPPLSDRERTALVWWLRSMTKASVARRMGISPHTVDMYIKRVRAKYAAAGWLLPTKADLLARAVEDGLVGPEDLAAVHRPGRLTR